VAGPQYSLTLGAWLWEVDFDSGIDGWVPEQFLREVGVEGTVTDAFVTSVYDSPTTYEAYKEYIRVGGWGDYYYGLIRFDVTEFPYPAQRAVIKLHTIPQAEVGIAMYLDRIDSYWDDSVMWSTKPAFTYYRPLPAAVPGEVYEIDITDMYNAWKSGTLPNYGIQLRPQGYPWNQWSQFYSSDYTTDEALQPSLIVTP
jgi:hypothetical protein